MDVELTVEAELVWSVDLWTTSDVGGCSRVDIGVVIFSAVVVCRDLVVLKPSIPGIDGLSVVVADVVLVVAADVV